MVRSQEQTPVREGILRERKKKNHLEEERVDVGKMEGGEMGFREPGEKVERGNTMGSTSFGGSLREAQWMMGKYLEESAD